MYNVLICDCCANSPQFAREIGKVQYDTLTCKYYISTDTLTKTGWEFFEVDEDDRDECLAELQGSGQE